jgi:hypothetical protein
MSMNPPPIPPDPYAASDPAVGAAPYASYYAPPELTGEAPPTSVTVIAIIGIIVGSVGIVANLCGGSSMVFVWALPAAAFGPTGKRAFQLGDATLQGYYIASMALGLVLSIICLFGSIKCYTLKESGRKVLLGWAAARIAVAAIELIAGVAWVNPRNQQLMAQRFAQTPGAAGAAAMSSAMSTGFVRQTQAVTAVLGFVVLCIFPVCVLVFLNRPIARDAFTRSAHPFGSEPYPSANPGYTLGAHGAAPPVPPRASLMDPAGPS